MAAIEMMIQIHSHMYSVREGEVVLCPDLTLSPEKESGDASLKQAHVMTSSHALA